MDDTANTTGGADGLLLAGGRSSRFGSDKRFALLDGEGLARIALGKLRQVIPRGAIHVATGRSARVLPGLEDVPALADAVADSGPLGGIVAGLRRTQSGILVLACDVPRVRTETLHEVLVSREDGRRPVAARRAGRWEPLIAYYPRSVSNRLEAALRDGDRALHRLLDELDAIPVEVSDPSELANVNTPEDLAALVEASEEDTQ